MKPGPLYVFLLCASLPLSRTAAWWNDCILCTKTDEVEPITLINSPISAKLGSINTRVQPLPDSDEVEFLNLPTAPTPAKLGLKNTPIQPLPVSLEVELFNLPNAPLQAKKRLKNTLMKPRPVLCTEDPYSPKYYIPAAERPPITRQH
jgi:hypothetical protein